MCLRDKAVPAKGAESAATKMAEVPASAPVAPPSDPPYEEYLQMLPAQTQAILAGRRAQEQLLG